MAATNRTDNYNLPIFISTDIPTWLGDWNSTMRSLDSAVKAVDTLATNLGSSKANASDVYTKAQVDTILQGYAGSPIVLNFNLLSSGWVQSGDVFTQTISAGGVLSTDHPLVQADCSTEAQAEAWAKVIKAEAIADNITFTALEGLTETLSITALIIR